MGRDIPWDQEERVEDGVGYRWMFWIMPVMRRMIVMSWFLVQLRMVIEVSIKLPKTKMICLSTGGGVIKCVRPNKQFAALVTS